MKTQHPTRRIKSKSSITGPPEFAVPVGLRLTGKAETRQAWELTLEGPRVFERCPRCRTLSGPNRFKPLGPRVIGAQDMPIANKCVRLTVSRYRFRCMSCHHVFSLPVRELDAGRRGMTLRLVQYLKSHVLEITSAQLVARTQVSVPTLSRTAIELIEELEAKRRIAVPRFLGVFSCETPRRRFGLITNAEDGTLLDFLDDDATDTIEQWFDRLGPAISTIETVQIDLHEAHRSIVRTTLPGVNLVSNWGCIDKVAQRVLTQAVSRLGTMGWTVHEKLKRDRAILLRAHTELTSNEVKKVESILKRHPYLRLYYDLKEGFDKIRTAVNRSEARSYYCEWRSLVPNEHLVYFEPVLSTLSEWEDELFGSLGLPQRMLNHADGLREVVRELNKSGAGFSYPQLRGRLLFSKTLQQKILRVTSTQAEPTHVKAMV